LDEAFFESEQARRQPEQTLAEYSGFVYGNPMTQIPTQTQTGTQTPFQPSLGQTLLGGGLQLGGAFLGSRGGSNYFASMLPGYKAPGQAKHGGYISREGGGFIDRDRGLSGLPMFRRQVPGQVIEEEDVIVDDTRDVELAMAAEETPEEIGTDRTTLLTQLATKAGDFPGYRTPDETKAAGEAKKARRMAVFDKIIGEKGQLKLGDVMIAVGQGLMAGGGMAYGKAFEDLTKKLQKERGDVSQLQAQQLISNLEIDELTDEQIRLLPRELAQYRAALTKAKRQARLEEAQIKKTEKEAKIAGRSKKAPTKIDDNARKQVNAEIETIADGFFIGKKDTLSYGGKKVDRNKIGEMLKGLNIQSQRGMASQAFEKVRTGEADSLTEGVMIVIKERIASGNLKTGTSIIEDIKTGIFD